VIGAMMIANCRIIVGLSDLTLSMTAGIGSSRHGAKTSRSRRSPCRAGPKIRKPTAPRVRLRTAALEIACFTAGD